MTAQGGKGLRNDIVADPGMKRIRIAPTYAPHCYPLYLWTDPAGVTALLSRWTEKLPGGPQAGWTPLAKVMGVGRQQQESSMHFCKC